MALPGEADPSILMAHLAAGGVKLAVPRVVGRNAALVFHDYDAGTDLRPGTFGVPEPDPASPRALPALLLVPLLAFDRTGRRLGYGGGYYDRTLKDLRAKGPLTAVGVAYAGQEVENLPHDDHDECLDMVLTEAGLSRFAKQR
jgi:5-formyltetrahydrofolate cyclo-ligase